MVSRRFSSRATRDLRLEQLVSPVPELGLVAANGPNDPEPELGVEGGTVTRMDGRESADFDVIDRFVVAHGLDLQVASEAMSMDDLALARMLVDVNVPRSELVRLSRGLTPAKLARVIGLLDPVELMLALKKLRARRARAVGCERRGGAGGNRAFDRGARGGVGPPGFDEGVEVAFGHRLRDRRANQVRGAEGRRWKPSGLEMPSK